MKNLFILLSIMFLMFFVNPSSSAQEPTSQAGAPRISNLKFSANPVTPGSKFLISFEFEGDVDCLFIENAYETQSNEIKRDLKEFSIPSEIKGDRKGIVTRQWETQKGSTAKPYRILSVWVKDAKGNQSNVLSGEIKIAVAMPTISRDAQWLLGSWTGILPGKEKTRTLKINEDKDVVKALYGITGEQAQPIALTVDGNQISFTTPALTQVTLKQISERRMDGLFQTKGGATPTSIRFWKDGETTDVDPQLKAFLGTWQGKSYWEGAPFQKPSLEFDMKITVAYIDSTAAAVLRENSEFVSLDGPRVKANWAWCHATVTPKRTIEFPFWHPRGVFVSKLSRDGKYLQGEVKGLDDFQFSPNSFKLKRADN